MITDLKREELPNWLVILWGVRPDLAEKAEVEYASHKERVEMYKECFEKFIPVNKWDEATLFLSTYGSVLAKEIARKQLPQI